MPTYEYACRECGNTLEVFQSFSDKPLKKCPECGGLLKKVFHARGIVFKGSGFYATDSRSKGSSNSDTTASKADSKPKTGAKASSASSSED